MTTEGNLDWNSIRPIRGSVANGFEELCTQLAEKQLPEGTKFYRIGAPDGGVECFAIFHDSDEWGWQAKFFHDLGEAQWKQLDDSVNTALEKHPRLVRYFVCVPLDRPDARISGRRSAMARWLEHVQKWTEWASQRDMRVEFLWQGSHEIINLLQMPEQAGILSFFFSTSRFSADWFTKRYEEAKHTAGPRYTPEIHVDLPIAKEFEAFGRTAFFIDDIKSHAKKFRSMLKNIEYSFSELRKTGLEIPTPPFNEPIEVILQAFADLNSNPTEDIGIRRIIDCISSFSKEIEKFLSVLENQKEKNCAKAELESGGQIISHYIGTPLENLQHTIQRSVFELRAIAEDLDHADKVSGESLLFLAGAAGMGKTHLLCDVTKRRLESGIPTILLMGQKFIGDGSPWRQLLDQLDLPDMSVEEFVGCLEAAGKIAGKKVFFMIDALNEGKGPLIWPANLAAFLLPLKNSPWVSVVLSIRSSYLETVVPEEVRKNAVLLSHNGFAEHEYEAARSFFAFYHLDFQSTPLLAPEFRNPFFLKTLCSTLAEMGVKSLSRGSHGISKIFNLYLGAINKRFSRPDYLDFNGSKNLVGKALRAFVEALPDPRSRWLQSEKAEQVINDILPGRPFSRSLYGALLKEGLFVQEGYKEETGEVVSFTYITYDRFADHIIGDALLNACLECGPAESTITAVNLFPFLQGEDVYINEGLLESLCMLVPEKTGKEITEFLPELIDRFDFGNTFRTSLVWRSPTAFSEETRNVMNKLIRTENDSVSTIETLLTVTALSDHPYNAEFLDSNLRHKSMPERDAFWSIRLHRLWGKHGSVDRLVDWAYSIKAKDSIEDETALLSSLSLCWMFTSSNRFLRDRATQALVNLLSGRFEILGKLVDRFSDVDEPYVIERILAVAYGVSMRSNDADEVSKLAKIVYLKFFEQGTPPVNILLRDYARGVIQRALSLNPQLEVDASRTRPPYKSEWPTIPPEEEIARLVSECESQGLGAWRIMSSVINGDFARYVIGTNSGFTEWLSLKLGEPTWQSREEKLISLENLLLPKEKIAWNRLKASKRSMDQVVFVCLLDALHEDISQESDQELKKGISVPDKAQVRYDSALSSFRKLKNGKNNVTIEALEALLDGEEDFRPPRFDLRLVQRYVLKRVFDLGWNEKRFGDFDTTLKGDPGRSAMKAERLGKKYQWIAYHEIMALITDHFQFLDMSRNDELGRTYDGPWQGRFRNIDPSCSFSRTFAKPWYEPHSNAWWSRESFDDWGGNENSKNWVENIDSLPSLGNLLIVKAPVHDSRWVNTHGMFLWQEQVPPDQDPFNIERRQIWFMFHACLIKEDGTDAFMRWAKRKDFWGSWMPSPPHRYEVFLGEHGWSPASKYFRHRYYGDSGWENPGEKCPVELLPVSFEYFRETGNFDCSVELPFNLKLPSSWVIEAMGLKWNGTGSEYVNAEGKLSTFDPSLGEEGPSALLFEECALREFLAREKLNICWIITGEKRVLSKISDRSSTVPSLRISGASTFKEGGLSGFLNLNIEEMDGKGDIKLRLLNRKTIKS